MVLKNGIPKTVSTVFVLVLVVVIVLVLIVVIVLVLITIVAVVSMPITSRAFELLHFSGQATCTGAVLCGYITVAPVFLVRLEKGGHCVLCDSVTQKAKKPPDMEGGGGGGTGRHVVPMQRQKKSSRSEASNDTVVLLISSRATL